MRRNRKRNRRKSRFMLKMVILMELLAIGGILCVLCFSVKAGSGSSLAAISKLFFGQREDRSGNPVEDGGGAGASGEAAIVGQTGINGQTDMGGQTNAEGQASENQIKNPPELLTQYMDLLSQKEYEQMYNMLDIAASNNLSQETFISRNSAIYEGIEMANLSVEVTEYDEESGILYFHTAFDTIAGNISFDNEALFLEKEGIYRLVWSDSMIFPGLGSKDKVRVSVTQAERGRIVDRNGTLLAGKGLMSSVGIVPGNLEDENAAITKIAEILDMEEESIRKKLSAKWVKADSFVPLKLIPRVDERRLMSPEASEETLQELERHEKLLAISGVGITDQEVRSYPLGEAASHLIGYVQNVTAEDLEAHPGEGYTAASVIGRCGIEGLCEKELKGSNGYKIYIADEDGKVKKELACRAVQHGRDIKLTIDAALQVQLYEEFREDKSCSVAMDPDTGEVLALVSTPSYDGNDFILGMSTEKWDALNADEAMPLYNRFRQVWCPGSTFKAVTAAIGLDMGAIDPQADFGNDGARWQKDSSWGGYYVTTLHPAVPANLGNALLLSDNIYFAKAALQIGAEGMENGLTRLGFGEAMPFEIGMAGSRFSNTEEIETQIQLADSGYGQGQILVNPLHLASIYSAFCNEGNLVQPWLIQGGAPGMEAWQDGMKAPGNEERMSEVSEAEESQVGAGRYWITNGFSADTAAQVQEALIQIVNNPDGTGYGAHREDILLAGKTGTAEIKASKGDTTGTELGWMVLFTPEKTVNRPILLVSMVEDVKGRGGSGYVVKKDKKILEFWFGGGMAQ